MVPQKGAKQQKATRDRRASSTNSWEDSSGVEAHQQQRTWASRLELEGVAIPWNASIREFQRGYSTYIVDALKQPFLLPKDMEALRQLNLYYVPEKGS